MSSSPTAPTSTTASSTSSPSPPAEATGVPVDGAFDPVDGAGAVGPAPERVGVIACGALAAHVSELAGEHGWPVDVHALSPLLHNAPRRIAGAVEQLAAELRPRYGDRLAVAYADCGTYGALDEVCDRLGLRRLGGLHCYDVFAGAERVQSLLEEEPGTYLLTDFLVRSFDRTVLTELGLDRWPELRADYFGHYRRVVWLAQAPTPELRAAAERAAAALGLPLDVEVVGDGGLAVELARLVGAAPPGHGSAAPPARVGHNRASRRP